ncbi:hypothetical protein E2C01_090705 [Portunus trituberculatus]|uniref:Uncharacterized protein n=1 Tax=Portunus trituberculatus TaxID=210409 RepID=A0A5B7JC05_PORTR|nr:hypothetical protein [Portunus trituberculatus]
MKGGIAIKKVSRPPLPAIRASLGYQKNHIHFLKVDINGDEWSVMEKYALRMFPRARPRRAGDGGKHRALLCFAFNVVFEVESD